MKLAFFIIVRWGRGCWEAPKARAGQSSKNWQEILRMNPGGDSQKSKRERGFCWNIAIWLKPLPVCSQKCQSHVQGFHILPSILKAGSLPWNNEILHFLFYQNLSNLKKSTNTILVVFYHSRSKCWKEADKRVISRCWELREHNKWWKWWKDLCSERLQWVLKAFHTQCPPGSSGGEVKPLSAVSESGCRETSSSPLLR